MKRILILGLATVAAVSQATILTFDIGGNTNGQILQQGYGDNVNAATMGSFDYDISNGTTQDVSVSYFGSPGQQADVNWWSTGYSDLTNVMEYEPDGLPTFGVSFFAANNNNSLSDGLEVVLNSFDLGNFGGAVTLPGLRVKDGSGNVLWEMLNISVPSSNSAHLSFNVGVSAEVLVLEVDTTGLSSNSDNIGLDNISFNQQVVPEPFTMTGIAVLGFLAARRRK